LDYLTTVFKDGTVVRWSWIFYCKGCERKL